MLIIVKLLTVQTGAIDYHSLIDIANYCVCILNLMSTSMQTVHCENFILSFWMFLISADYINSLTRAAVPGVLLLQHHRSV